MILSGNENYCGSVKVILSFGKRFRSGNETLLRQRQGHAFFLHSCFTKIEGIEGIGVVFGFLYFFRKLERLAHMPSGAMLSAAIGAHAVGGHAASGDWRTCRQRRVGGHAVNGDLAVITPIPPIRYTILDHLILHSY